MPILPAPSVIVLRPYQEKGITDIRAAFRAGKRSIAYVAPTGSGKTRILVYIAHGAIAKSNRIMIMVHRQELVRQTSNALADLGVAHGFIAANREMNPEIPVQLAMVQTLVKRIDSVISPNLLIVDEYHHGVSESYIQVARRFPNAKVLGLTATPQRLDGRGLGIICEQLVLGPSVQQLIDLGFLCVPEYYAPPSELDLSHVGHTAGDFNKKEVDEAVDRPSITGSAVDHYARICPGVAAVAFCTSVKHAEHVRDQFIAAGYPAAMIDGKLDEDSRADRVAALAEGRIKILTSVDVISEGFDLPSVGAAILLRPTESLSLHLQQIGRVLRPQPGKAKAIILDHVGNCMRHGLAEEDRQWSLAGAPKRKQGTLLHAESVVTCPKCFAVQKRALVCAACGAPLPQQNRAIAEKEGSLQVLTMQAILQERERLQKRAEIGRAKTMEELVAIAKQRGYKPTWVRMMMRVRSIQQSARKTNDSSQTEFKI
jgi:DNA repair protein RadD